MLRKMALQNLPVEIGVAMQNLKDGLFERLTVLSVPLGQNRTESHM